MLTYEEALEYIHGRKKLPSAGSIPRINALLDRIGHPEKKLSCVHITGTNGKGSAALLFSRALMLSGRRTGLFISPFILDFRERIQIDGEMIPKEELAALTTELAAEVDALEAEGTDISEFELDTALAFSWFRKQNCAAAVLEVGIGGTYDATNIIPPPMLSVIMGIGLDHQNLLGETVEEIAANKAGIIKGNPAVCYPFQQPGVLAELMKRCAATGSVLHMPSPADVEIVSETFAGTDFVYGGEKYHISLPGRYQVYNSITFIKGAEVLGLPREAVREAMNHAYFPVRMELLSREKPLFLDGAHNPHGMKALTESISALWKGRLTAVIGMLADKDRSDTLALLAPICTKIYTVTVDNPRTADAEDTASLVKPYCADVRACGDWREGLRRAVQEQTDDLILVCGSLYLASDARNFFLTEEPGLLRG